LRDFDQRAGSARARCAGARCASAPAWIAEYGVKTQGETRAIRGLSGGNVQRAVLARELAARCNVLIVSNPCLRPRLRRRRRDPRPHHEGAQRGAAVLLVSEDLDELLLLADRIVVMSEGRIVHDVPAASADRRSLGAFMGGKASMSTLTAHRVPEAA
jgi:ABC-type uncharacterized transport system ATPase subunit